MVPAGKSDKGTMTTFVEQTMGGGVLSTIKVGLSPNTTIRYY